MINHKESYLINWKLFRNNQQQETQIEWEALEEVIKLIDHSL